MPGARAEALISARRLPRRGKGRLRHRPGGRPPKQVAGSPVKPSASSLGCASEGENRTWEWRKSIAEQGFQWSDPLSRWRFQGAELGPLGWIAPPSL